jgi:hypothetical protein
MSKDWPRVPLEEVLTYTTYSIGDICKIVKGTYPTLNTPPGEYPLVVTAPFRRSADTYQIEG